MSNQSRLLIALAVAGCAGVVFVGAALLSSSGDSGRQPKPAAVADQSTVGAEDEGVSRLEAEERGLAEQVLRSFPDDADALLLAGTAQKWHGNTAKAVENWERALAIDSKRPDIYEQLGQLWIEREELHKSVEVLKEGLAAVPDAPGLRFRIAQALVSLGEHARAIEQLRQECEIAPRESRNYYLLGQAFAQLKQYDQAKANYLKAVEIKPEYFNAYYGLATVCARLRQRDEARKYMATFEETEQKYDDAVAMLDVVDQIPRIRRRTATLYLQAHEVYCKHKRLEQAELSIKRAIELDPDRTLYRDKLAIFCSQTSRLPEALAVFEQVCRMDPNNSLCHTNVGQVAATLGMYARAESAFREAIGLAPEKGLGYRDLARFYLRSNTELAEARKLAEEAVRLDPVARNYFILSWACDVNGDAQNALRAIEQAIKLDPTDPKYKDVYDRIRSRN